MTRAERPVDTDRDAAALRALHREHAGALWGYVVRLTRDPARAEDIVQETMLRAWRHGVAETQQGSARAWLFTVAHHLVVDQARSAAARHEAVTEYVPEVPSSDRVEALLESLLVGDALGALTRDHLEVVVRAYYGRLSTAEIAEELEIPAGTVKSRLHYGLRALRLALQERGVSR